MINTKLLISNIVCISMLLLLCWFDTRDSEIAMINDYMDFTHGEICGENTEVFRTDSIIGLIEYDTNFMANFTDDVNIKFESFEDVESFVNSHKVECQSYASAYINRNIWKYIEYAIADDDTIQDYWKIKYYCSQNIGTYNYLLNTDYGLECYVIETTPYFILITFFILVLTNVYTILSGFFMKQRNK